MGRDDASKEPTNINLYQYQKEYLKEQGYNISEVVRQAVDDRIVQDGANPDRLEQTHGD